MEYTIITNNSKVYNIYKETNEVLFYQKKDLVDLLSIIKEKIYLGHKLLSDPIMYNLENIENPYKSIAISKYPIEVDPTQKKMIEGALSIANKIAGRKKFQNFEEDRLEEFRFVDLNILLEFTKRFDNF